MTGTLMNKVYLFDWGDTLMVDFAHCSGKMCHWQHVQAVDGAQQVLATLSQDAKIFIATGAADSTENDIKSAFERVGLAPYISGYFCQDNVGHAKGTSGFFPTILIKLNLPAAQVAMVGDNYQKDILPACQAGLQPYWFTSDSNHSDFEGVNIIRNLQQLVNFNNE